MFVLYYFYTFVWNIHYLKVTVCWTEEDIKMKKKPYKSAACIFMNNKFSVSQNIYLKIILQYHKTKQL